MFNELLGKSLFFFRMQLGKNQFVLGIRVSVQVGFDVLNNGRSSSS